MVTETLFLTADERTLFERLPYSLKEGCSVIDDVMEYIDSEDRRRLRMSTVYVQDARLKQFHDKAHSSITIEEATNMLQEIDLRDINQTDVREILYALGPDVLSAIVGLLLRTAGGVDDIHEAAAYSTARHLFFGRNV